MATELKDRVKVGLDEGRMIVLVVQVLLGFECRAAFEPRFEQLPVVGQTLKMISFALLIVTLALLLAVPAYHRIAADGQTTHECERILRQLMTTALFPFALALGIDCGIATLAVFGTTAGFIVAAAAAALALFCWYALGSIRAASRSSNRGESMDEKPKLTPLDEKIKQVLTECRIVLPGTQAFLGFQLSAFLTDAFAKLQRPEQIIHLGALGLVALSGILLMTPPAYHRIAEKGQMTPHFLRVANAFLLAAMLPLALGISADFYVVLAKVTHASGLALIIATLAFLTFVGCWVAFPYWSRSHGERRSVGGRAGVRAAA